MSALLLACSAIALASVGAQQLSQFDPLNEIRIEQRLGEQLPLDARFRDEMGEDVRLGSFFQSRPVVLALVYYDCPMLCNLVLNGLVSALEPIALAPGKDLEVVVISIDPGETPALGLKKRERVLQLYGHPETASGWHFLVGDESAIRAVADAVGFRYRYDPALDEYAHASGIVVATPAGELSRYFYGVTYRSSDLRLGLVDASAGKLGSPVDQVLLLCYRYDPATGKYGFAIMGALRVAAVLTVLALGGAVLLMLSRERARRHAAPTPRDSRGEG